MPATELVTAIIASPDGVRFAEEQVIDREKVTDSSDLDLSSATLSASDLGCEPGTLYRVSLVDDEDRVLDSVEIAAQ